MACADEQVDVFYYSTRVVVLVQSNTEQLVLSKILMKLQSIIYIYVSINEKVKLYSGRFIHGA